VRRLFSDRGIHEVRHYDHLETIDGGKEEKGGGIWNELTLLR